MKSWTTTAFIIFHDLATLFETFLPLEKNWLFTASPPYESNSSVQLSLAFFPNFTQNVMLVRCSIKTDH